jgi:glycosyltransferase involved in cell wall biosynthesis
MNFGEVFIARLLGFKIILHVHEGYDFAKNFKYKLKISCFCVGSIIVGSHYANQSLRKLTGFVGKVIHNGIELGINKSNISNEVSQLKLGILGTINPNKGQIVALKAVKELIKNGNKVHLSLAGQSCDEIYFNQITEYINKNDLNSYVDLLGFVSDSSCFLKGLDLLIVPSYDEVFPTVVLEALSIGLPVIASNAGGIPEIIDDKKNSYLFEVGNFIELVKIIHNISINKAQLEPVSKNAIETIESSFSVNSMVSKINLNIEACLYG